VESRFHTELFKPVPRFNTKAYQNDHSWDNSSSGSITPQAIKNNSDKTNTSAKTIVIDPTSMNPNECNHYERATNNFNNANTTATKTIPNKSRQYTRIDSHINSNVQSKIALIVRLVDNATTAKIRALDTPSRNNTSSPLT